MTSPFPGPTPPYNNPPIEPQFYSPSRFDISDIQLGQTTIVTVLPTTINGFTVDLNYSLGQEVRLIIPNGYGCRELNEVIGIVIGFPGDEQVEIQINSQNASPFINANLLQKPQIIAIGDVNTGAINMFGRAPQQTFIPGSFINISPL